MTIHGDSDLWADTFPEDLVPKILDLVLEAWEKFPKPKRNAREVPTTRALRPFLIRTKNFRRLPLRIDREDPEDDLDRGVEKGRIDLRLTPAISAREEVYFAFECKRLNAFVGGEIKSLSWEYVVDGMMRFVTAQYSATQSHGGMIGYVLDGDVTSAINNVRGSIRTRQADLHIPGTGDLDQSSMRPSRAELRETRHHLPGRVLSLHHMFLAS